MKYSFILFFLALFKPCLAQNSPYCVHVSNATSLTDIASVQVKVMKHGIIQFNSQTNFDGRVHFPVEIASDSSNIIVFKATGFHTEEMKASQLIAGNTLELRMQYEPIQLDEVVIIAYKMPIIEEEISRKERRKTRRKKEQETIVMKDTIVYTAEEMAAFDLLKGEGWDLKDSVSVSGTAGSRYMQNYYAGKLFYTEKALKYELEEKMFFTLVVNKKGDKIRLKLLKGKNPELVLAAARAITRSPRLMFEDPLMRNTVEINLPFKFMLK